MPTSCEYFLFPPSFLILPSLSIPPFPPTQCCRTLTSKVTAFSIKLQSNTNNIDQGGGGTGGRRIAICPLTILFNVSQILHFVSTLMSKIVYKSKIKQTKVLPLTQILLLKNVQKNCLESYLTVRCPHQSLQSSINSVIRFF